MKGNGGLALIGDYSDEEEAGADLDAYVGKSGVRTKKRKHQEFVENDDDSSADEAETQEPEMPQAALFLDYGTDSDEEKDDEEEERQTFASPEPEEMDASDNFRAASLVSEPTPVSPAAQDVKDAAPAPPRKRVHELDEMFNLLPPAKRSCPKDLRDKVKKYMQLKDQGQSINGKISTMKSLRNPYILEDLLVRHGLDELGSNFSTERFNPHGFHPSDFHEALQKTQHQMMTAQAKKQQGIVEFTNGTKTESSTLAGSTGDGRRARKGNISRWDVAGGGGIQA